MSIRVLLVDDSAVMRQALGSVLQSTPGIELQAAVADPILAMRRMEQQWPDVVVLDVEMPRMDGITFLRKIMQVRPTPVVICSTLTEKGAHTTLDAMAAGAFTAIAKPRLGLRDFLSEHAQELVATIRAASQANVARLAAGAAPRGMHAASGSQAPAVAAAGAAPVKDRHEGQGAQAAPCSATAQAGAAPAVPHRGMRSLSQTTERVVAIGTSTGGTQALEAILTALPRLSPGIVIVQHMPEKFTAAFAQRLNSLCAIDVREAQDGDRVLPGVALIAPGGRHMVLRRSGAQYYVEVVDGPLVSRHRPSVNVLFRSVAHTAGANALGIIMTGMGDDGAAGLLEMRQAGSRTVAQDEASCVVFGMPKEAIKKGAAERVVDLHAIPEVIGSYTKNSDVCTQSHKDFNS